MPYVIQVRRPTPLGWIVIGIMVYTHVIVRKV